MAKKRRCAFVIAFVISIGATLNATLATPFLAMGPSGGQSSQAAKDEFAAEIPPTATLALINVFGRDTVEKVEFVYFLHPFSWRNPEGVLDYPKGPVVAWDKNGNHNNPRNLFAYHLKPGEYVVGMFGTTSPDVLPDGRDTIVRTIQFKMNTGTVTGLPPSTQAGRGYFAYNIPEGYHIGGLFGSVSPGNTIINSVGIIVQPGAPVPCCD